MSASLRPQTPLTFRDYTYYTPEIDPLNQEPTPQEYLPDSLAYFHLDHLGTPIEMTDRTGKTVWEATYKAWGEVESVSGSLKQPFRFQGQYFDEESGLHYNRFRYYDPSSGRFVSQDPIGLLGGFNLYGYAPNPVDWIDSLGLTPKSIIAKIMDVKSGISVNACSYKEANQILFGAFPDAQKSAGSGNKSGAKTARDKSAFKQNRQNSTGRASYHMDFKINPTTGVLYGHESLPDGHPHKTIPHINIFTPSGKKVDIFIINNRMCNLQKGKK